MTTATASSAVTIRVAANGESILSSADPWYRYLAAAVDLFLARRIDLDWLAGINVSCMREIHSEGDGAAKQLLNAITNVCWAPSCACDPYTKPCGHPELTDDERRHWLSELIGQA